MISRRNKRPGKPQESLRQFALNNSKGMDSTKAPTDVNTLYYSNNLIVNPDGSMSLRKPLKYVNGSAMSRVYTLPPTIGGTAEYTGLASYRLYDGKHKLIVIERGSICKVIVEDADGVAQTVKATYTGHDGTERSFTTTSITFLKPVGTIEVFNLNSATIIGNCDVNLKIFGDDVVDLSLYDIGSVPSGITLPRYVRLFFAPDEGDNGTWVLDVHSPEVNTLTTAEGDVVLNPNMLLDNPTAIQDIYNSAVPAVRGILAYAPSKLENGKPVYTDLVKYPYSDHTFAELESMFKHYNFSVNDTTVDTATIALENAPIDVTLTLSRDSDTLDCTLNLKLSDGVAINPSRRYFLKIDVNCLAEYFLMSEHYELFKNELECSFEELSEGISVSNKIKFEFTDVGCTIYIPYKFSVTAFTVSDETRVADITESAASNRYRITSGLIKDSAGTVFLKAFCNLPSSSNAYYAAWFKSVDGTTWNPLNTFHRALDTGTIKVKELSPKWKLTHDVEKDTPTDTDYDVFEYYPLKGVSKTDVAFEIVKSSDAYPSLGSASEYVYVNHRIDVININRIDEPVGEAMYRFKIVVVEPSESDAATTGDDASVVTHDILAIVAQQDYTPVFKDNFEFFDVEFGNAVYGKKLYHKKSIYSYGSEKFLNNIFVSDIDSFVTPLYNIIDLDTYEASQATCLVPWRDYIVSATSNAMYLHAKQEGGFLTKTVNTSIGIPEEDSKCCKPILNGIIFKSGPKVYQLYPNLYSGDDSTLNITEISKAVEEVLEGYVVVEHTPFAFSTASEYVLMLPNETDTTCLRYDYSSKLWTVCSYPIVAQYYEILSLDDIRIFGITKDWFAEYKFDSETFDSEPFDSRYGDTLPELDEKKNIVPKLHPIKFEWDTGQKTDNISVPKQFVESKIIFATEDEFEFFPMSLTVCVDGDPHVTTLDINSDAPFWKINDSKGVANTAFRLGDGSKTGVFRQLIARYSGKGKSVRHILSGNPTSNFRLYETYVRYKLLNIKR